MRRRRKQRVAPAPPPVVKQPKPRMHELKEIYQKLYSGSIAVRIAAFFEAQQFWEKFIAVFMAPPHKLTPEGIKKFGQAAKSLNLAIGAGTEQEKEAALIRTIALYEGIWAKHNVISYKPFYKKYEENKVKLQEKEAAANARFQTVLEALNSAFLPLKLKFELVKQTNTGGLREFDGDGKILLTIALAKVLNEKMKQEGILPVLFSEAKTAAIAGGMEKAPDAAVPGGYRLVPNMKKIIDSMPIAMDGILQYIGTIGSKKIFKHYGGTLEATAAIAVPASHVHKVRVNSNGSKVPKGTRIPRASGGNLIGGRYSPGTACAILYTALSDQKVHPLSEVLKLVNATNPQDRLNWLRKHGARNGKWSVILHGNTVQMIVP